MQKCNSSLTLRRDPPPTLGTYKLPAILVPCGKVKIITKTLNQKTILISSGDFFPHWDKTQWPVLKLKFPLQITAALY